MYVYSQGVLIYCKIPRRFVEQFTEEQEGAEALPGESSNINN